MRNRHFSSLEAFFWQLSLLFLMKQCESNYMEKLQSIYKFSLSVCLGVCLFVSNKRQNGWTDRAQIFGVTSQDPREGLWMIKFSKICLYQNSIFENFENPRNFFSKIREIFCFCYLLTRRTPVYFISNTNFYKWNKRWARSAPNF